MCNPHATGRPQSSDRLVPVPDRNSVDLVRHAHRVCGKSFPVAHDAGLTGRGDLILHMIAYVWGSLYPSPVATLPRFAVSGTKRRPCSVHAACEVMMVEGTICRVVRDGWDVQAEEQV